jgi:hypothetical protein
VPVFDGAVLVYGNATDPQASVPATGRRVAAVLAREIRPQDLHRGLVVLGGCQHDRARSVAIVGEADVLADVPPFRGETLQEESGLETDCVLDRTRRVDS